MTCTQGTCSPVSVLLRWSGSSSRWWRGGSRGITSRPRPVPCQAPPTAVRPRAASSTTMPSGAVCGTLWVCFISGNLCLPLPVYSSTMRSNKCPTCSQWSQGTLRHAFISEDWAPLFARIYSGCRSKVTGVCGVIPIAAGSVRDLCVSVGGGVVAFLDLILGLKEVV